ncbi:MAG: hypothetical protein AAF587_40530 [Bacteroidota bacterium]
MNTPLNKQCAGTDVIRNGYILLSIDTMVTPLILNHMINIAHNIFGPSIHLHLRSYSQLIITLPLQPKASFVDKCHQFRQTLLAWRTKDIFLSKVLLVITLNREGENSEEVVHRLMRGQTVGSHLMESHGLCML